MKKLIKSIFILLGLKIKNFFRKWIKKPMVIKRGGKQYANVNQILKQSNRHGRRALKAWAKKNQDKIINVG